MLWLCTACGPGNRTIRRQANSRSVKSQTGQLADWITHGLDDSRTSQLADSEFVIITFGGWFGWWFLNGLNVPSTICAVVCQYTVSHKQQNRKEYIIGTAPHLYSAYFYPLPIYVPSPGVGMSWNQTHNVRLPTLMSHAKPLFPTKLTESTDSLVIDLVLVPTSSATWERPLSTILSWVGVAVNVSDVISVGKLPNVEISGTPQEQRRGIGWGQT